MSATIHASAVLVGATALLIQGPSGSGKSRLALRLIQASQSGALKFARLVGDDRVHIEAHDGRLLVRPAERLSGLMEVRGLGIRCVPYEKLAVVGFAIEIGANNAERLPDEASSIAEYAGISLPRLAVAQEMDPLPVVLAYLATSEGANAAPRWARNATE